MTESAPSFSAAIWQAMDLLRGLAPFDTARTFIVTLLLHRLRHPLRDDPQSVWQKIDHIPLAAINQMLQEVERELNIHIEHVELEPADARHLLHLVNDAAYVPKVDRGQTPPQIDAFLDLVNTEASEFYTPRSVVETMVDLLHLQPNRSIFDPAAGSGGMLSAALEHLARDGHGDALQVFGTEKHSNTAALARMNLALHGHASAGVVTADSFSPPNREVPEKFDYVISNPPVYREPSKERLQQLSEQPEFAFGPALPASDFNYIQLAVSRLKPNGTAALLVRLAPLFAGGKERDIRERLVMAGCVECVVTLAPRLLTTTRVPCAILLLKAPKQQAAEPVRVKLVAAEAEFGVDAHGKRILTPANIEKITAAVRSPDAIEGFSTIKTAEELAARGFSLLPSSYPQAERELLNLGPNTVMRRLGDVATIQRGSKLGRLQEGDVPILQGRDLSLRKLYRDDLKRKTLQADEHLTVTTEEGDILIQRIGESPSSYYVDKPLVDIVISDTVYIVRLHKPDESTGRFLVQFLRSSEGQARLRAAVPAGIIPTLSLRALQEMLVPFPDPEVVSLALDLEDLENALHEQVELSGELKSRLFDVRSPEQFAVTFRDLNLRYRILKDSLQHSGSLPELNATVGVATLEEAISIWEQNKDSGDEPFWHGVLQARPFLLAQLFHYPIVIVGSKVYVGGKRLDNHHGSVADFLAKSRNTGAALIIEIKTPGTELLGSEYRDDVFPWHREISGAISQVLHYQSSLTRNVVELRAGIDEHLESDTLRCLVIAGNVGEQLSSRAMRRGFERLRESLHGVSVIGFDELFGRAKEMLKILTSPQ